MPEASRERYLTTLARHLADYSVLSPQISWVIHANGEIWKQKDSDGLQNEYVAIIHQDHFK